MNYYAYRINCIVYTGFLFLGSVTPANDSTVASRALLSLQPEVQNLLHIPAFLCFSILFLKSFQNIPEAKLKKRFILVFAVGVVFGILLEAVQIIVPGRFPSLMDVVFNGVGVLVGIWIYRQWQRLCPSPS